VSRVREADVNAVKERAQIEEIVRDYVNLKSAGGGSLKGLCPFHDERSPSFHVTPARNFYHCFGCQESGDTIAFLRKIENLSFIEAIEKLANKYSITLHYEETTPEQDKQAGLRTRLVDAHRQAALFYQQQLASPEAETGRQFLIGRGFDSNAAKNFGVGYAPKGWDGLLNHLRGLGFKDEELLAGGLLSQGQRGTYDRFRGRLVWPIKDLSGDVVGFGARKLYDDDDGPKYLNTPETPIYKKSQVLYGLDLARKEIAKRQQVVVVEGYTDVMACHLAGITTAVATCGTAFGQDHIKVLRRLLLDSENANSEVVFTFDGDAAGRKAALRAFEDDQKFVAKTFVAVEPNGLDPCDLRMQSGDEALAHLIATKVPMFEFAIKSTLKELDLNTAEGRVNGLNICAPIIAAIKDPALKPEYTRMLAGWLGMDMNTVADAVGRVNKKTKAEVPRTETVSPQVEVLETPDPRKVEHRVEREALKSVLQEPKLAMDWYSSVEDLAYTFLPYRQIHQMVVELASQISFDELEPALWVESILAKIENPQLKTLASALVVEPINTANIENLEKFVTGVIARLQELDAARRIADLKGQLLREEEGSDTHQNLFAQLLALEGMRRTLAEHARGHGT
jgi:DNA primase